jgi:hypothetical protein
MAEGIYPHDDPAAMALELWAAAHGVASLYVSRPYFPWGRIEEFADRVVTAACMGHITSALLETNEATPQGLTPLSEHLKH